MFIRTVLRRIIEQHSCTTAALKTAVFKASVHVSSTSEWCTLSKQKLVSSLEIILTARFVSCILVVKVNKLENSPEAFPRTFLILESGQKQSAGCSVQRRFSDN